MTYEASLLGDFLEDRTRCLCDSFMMINNVKTLEVSTKRTHIHKIMEVKVRKVNGVKGKPCFATSSASDGGIESKGHLFTSPYPISTTIHSTSTNTRTTLRYTQMYACIHIHTHINVSSKFDGRNRMVCAHHCVPPRNRGHTISSLVVRHIK